VVRGDHAAAARHAVESVGGDVTYDLPIIDGVVGRVPRSAMSSLSRVQGVRAVTEDAAVEMAAVSASHAPSAIYPQVVGANKLWSQGITGRRVTVGVIDTGINRTHPDLKGRVIAGVDFSGENAPYNDRFGHGTFVAGIIAGNGASSAGKYKGVAPGARLVSIKIAGRDGSSDVSHILAALQWAVSFKDTYNIRVLNLSLGTNSTQPYRLSPLNFAVERAWDKGIAVVVSASNRGVNGSRTITKPGDDPLVITVGATDDKRTAGKSDDVMAGFSGMGPTAADGIRKPDVVAPGRSVIGLRAVESKIDRTYPTSRVDTWYFKGSGTSFSTAVTSGSLALLIQREARLVPDQLKNRLLSTATPGPVGNRNVDGFGQVDAFAAAHAGTTTRANQGVKRGVGTGSIDADRGTLPVQIMPPGTSVLLLGTLLTGQNKLFDGMEYIGVEWSGSSWFSSQWTGSSWYGSSWYGSSWYGSSWYGSSWYGSSWYGGWD
jgi:serine protease AprX